MINIRTSSPYLYTFGYGYSASYLAQLLQPEGWRIGGTCRTAEKQTKLTAQGIDTEIFNNEMKALTVPDSITHVLHSIPPGEHGDNVLPLFSDAARRFPRLQWFGYLSTTGVYGDHQGEWVTEQSDLRPVNARSRRRVDAERAWMRLYKIEKLPVHVFRLSGIYGPRRNAVNDVLSGKARRIIKPNQVFSRIHVEDIARMLYASINTPEPGNIYNGADDLPAASDEIITFAAKLTESALPPAIHYTDPQLSPMTRSFYESCRRVDNTKTKSIPKMRFLYPTYKDGLTALSTPKYSM